MAGPYLRPRGEVQAPSIYRHGFEFVAERIQSATRAGTVITVLANRNDGTVRYRHHLTDAQLLAVANGPDYIGTYSDKDRIECIEDQLLHWMRSTS